MQEMCFYREFELRHAVSLRESLLWVHGEDNFFTNYWAISCFIVKPLWYSAAVFPQWLYNSPHPQGKSS